MKRRSLTFMICAGMAATAALAQVELRMSDILRLNGLEAPEAQTENGKLRAAPSASVELIVRYDGSQEALDAITREGGEIVSLVGYRTAIVRVPRGGAQAVAACKGVTGAKLSEEVRPVNMVAREASHIDDIHKGTGLPLPFDGSGVVVGVYDIGMEPNHINFMDAEGNNRILNLWHYEDQTAKVTVYDTPQKIAGFDTDYGESHGTHVLGVLGGSFVDPENSKEDYRGMAPGSELAVAAGLGYNAQILDGLERIAKYAREQGKPCVINLSFGDNLGPHDGTDEFTEAINDIADKYDVPICMAAGNERDDAISIIKKFSADDPEIKTLLLKGSTDMDASFQSFGTIEIYGEDNTPFEVYLDIINRTNPDEVLYTLEVPEKKGAYLTQGSVIKDYVPNSSRLDLISEGTIFQEIYSSSFVGGVCETDPYNNRYHAQLNAYLQGRTATSVSRYFVRLRIKGQEGKKVFVYCDGTYMNFGTKNMPGLDKPDGNGTNSNMGSGPRTISVGSYITANVDGSPYTFGSVGDLSWFSSYGETPDGRFIPEVCAPGQVIISSRNSYIGTGSNALYIYPIHYSYYDKKKRATYEWTSCAGTSQASPHVAGAIALWLEANPNLTIDQIKSIIAETAAEAKSTQPGWGAGVFDAYAGIKSALHISGVESIDEASDKVMFRRGADMLEAFIPGARNIEVEVFTLSGMTASRYSVAGDTANISLSGLQKGLYVVRVTSNGVSQSLKINI